MPFSINTQQDMNDRIAYDMYRSFLSAFEVIKNRGESFTEIKNFCDSFVPIDARHPDAIDVPIPDIEDCRGEIIIAIQYNGVNVALTGYAEGTPELKDFTLADAYHATYADSLNKQYYYHEMKEKYAARDAFLDNPVQESPLMKFIEEEVPFRLTEIHDIEQPSPDLIDEIVTALQNHTDILFDYDRIDDFISDKIEQFEAELNKKQPRLDVLIRNTERKTTDEFETRKEKTKDTTMERI